MRQGIVAAITLAFLCGVALGDTLVTTDGRQIVGQIRKIDGGYEVTADDGTKTVVRDADVAALRIGEPSTRPAGDDEQNANVPPALASLRRSVQNLDDLAQIVSRYERFLEQTPTGPAADLAREDLERYRTFQAEGYVRYAGEWVAPGDRADALRAAFDRVAEARLAVKAGDAADAREQIDALLAIDPEHPAALYLAGVLAQRGDDAAEARALFERVRRRVPEHPPTLLNLAAINMAYPNMRPRALTFLADAMRVEPGNKQVLDNVAEALEMLEGREADSGQARRVRRLFEAQDAALQRELGEQGLYRWGSKWVDAARRAELEAVQAEIEQAVRQIEARRDVLAAEADLILRQIRDNETYLEQLDRSRYQRTPDGQVIQGPLPPAYYDARRRRDELALGLRDVEGRSALVDAEVAAERARLPLPPFEGRLMPVNEDGVPVTLPPPAPPEPEDDPATRPA